MCGCLLCRNRGIQLADIRVSCKFCIDLKVHIVDLDRLIYLISELSEGGQGREVSGRGGCVVLLV